MSISKTKLVDSVVTTVAARPDATDIGNVHGYVVARAYRDGKLLWEEAGPNIITNEGLTYLNGVALTSVTQVTSWYLGLVQDTSSPSDTLPTFAAGDTYDVPGETEVTAYDEANRVACTLVAGSAGVSSNTAAPAVFTISTNSTYVGGIKMVSNNTKGDHASGAGKYMFSGKAFSAVRTLQDNDTITITYTITNTSS